MSKKVIVVTGNFPPEGGGPAKFAETFSTWLSSRSDSVKVLSTTPKSSEHLKYSNIEVFLMSRLPNILFRYLSTVIKLGKISDKSSLIIANGCFLETYFAAVLFRLKYVAKVPGDIVWERARANKLTTLGMREFQLAKLPFKSRVHRYLFTQSLKRAEKVIVPSTAMINVCLNWGIAESKLSFIPNSVNLENYKPIKDSQINFDVITVSRLIWMKKIDELIKVCAKFKLSLLIVGDGPEDENLRKCAKEFGGKVEFFGNATQNELPNLYRESKYFILTSEFEAGTPYSLLEARACGLVCIANEYSGCSDVITDGVDGYLVNEKDPSGLKEKVSQALREKNKYHELSNLSRQDSLNRFSQEIVFDQISSLMMGSNS